MAEKPKPVEPDTVACDVCLSEIPSSTAINQEADDYVQHFCGIECYAKWRQTSDKANGDTEATD